MSTILPESATKKPVIGSEDDQDFICDLQLIARREPGKGAALQRMLDRAQTTQAALADALDLSRSTITHWCNEFRWPDDTTLRNALLKLNVDRKLILREFGPALVTRNSPIDPQEIAVSIFTSLFAVDDPFERETIIYSCLGEKVLIAQGVKGLTDSKAAALFFERMDKHMEEKRLRDQQSVRDVTPKSSQWAQGQGIVQESSAESRAETTISSDLKNSEDAPEPTTGKGSTE